MLTEKTNKIIEEVNELKEIFMKQFGEDMFDTIMDMEDEELIAMKKCFKLMDLSMELAVEQAQIMDDINAKLDKLLAMQEKGSN